MSITLSVGLNNQDELYTSEDPCLRASDNGIRKMPDLKKKLKLIKLDCGQVCDTDIQPLRKSKYYDYIEKDVDCLNLFESPVLEQTNLEGRPIVEGYQPPKFCELPKDLRNLFTHNGRLRVTITNLRLVCLQQAF